MKAFYDQKITMCIADHIEGKFLSSTVIRFFHFSVLKMTIFLSQLQEVQLFH